MKKQQLLCIALTALMLTSCEKKDEGEVTGVPSETTSLTLTVSLTESAPPPEPVPQLIEFAVYDPFADVVKVENSVRKELAEAVEKLSDARGFLYARPTMFYYKSKYYSYICLDDKEILEENKEDEYEYFSLNIDIAQTEEDLVQYMRSCFTENFISDGELQRTLFEAENEHVPAEYKTIDGTLCMRQQYLGVSPNMYFDKFSVLEYDGTSAKVAVYGESIADPPYMIFMDIVKSEEYGWRVDGMEIKECWQNEAEVLYNAITLRTETLNKILDGGNVPENAKSKNIDGNVYTQTDLDMTISEMLDFFGEMFHSDYNATKYITDVYAEFDGELYRKVGVPRRYLPEMKLDPCYGINGSGSFGDEAELVCEQEFYDSITLESFTQKITVIFSSEYLGYNEEERRQEFEYNYIHIVSELPIRERDSSVIFIGENKAENIDGYADKNYAVNTEAAFENVLKTGIIPDNSKLLCSGAVQFKNEIYYVIERVFDNGDTVVTEDTFWVNAESGVVYIYLDPSLPVSEYLAEYKAQIEADDSRSRIVWVYMP